MSFITGALSPQAKPDVTKLSNSTLTCANIEVRYTTSGRLRFPANPSMSSSSSSQLDLLMHVGVNDSSGVLTKLFPVVSMPPTLPVLVRVASALPDCHPTRIYISREDMVTSASQLWEILGNLPPQSSVSYSCTLRGERSPSAASRATPSRSNITTSPEPMSEVHNVIGCSFEKRVEVRKRSPERRYSTLEDRNDPGGVVETFFGVGFPLVKRRRVPVRIIRAASDIPSPDVERMDFPLPPKIDGHDGRTGVSSRRHLVKAANLVVASRSVAPTPARQ